MAAKKGVRKFFGTFLGVIAVIALAGYGYFLSLRRSTDKTLAALRSQGVPASIAEYRQSIPHDGPDTISYYNDLFTAPSRGRDAEVVSLRFDRRTDQVAARAKLARKAAAGGWCDFYAGEGRVPNREESLSLAQSLGAGSAALVFNATDLRPDLNIDVRFNDLLYASRMAANRARSAVGEGEDREALALERTAMEGWQHLLASDCRDPNTVRAAERTLNQMPDLPSLRHLFVAQFVAGMWINRHLEQYLAGWTEPGSVPTRDEMQQEWLNSKAGETVRLTEYVAAWRDVFAKLPEDDNDWRGYLDAIRTVEEERTKMDDLSPWTGIHQMPRVIGPWAERLAYRRMARTALAVLKQRIQAGKLPDSLPETGEESTDPFSGKPFGYKRQDDGFLIYSQGSTPEEGGQLIPAHVFPRTEFPLSQTYP